MEKENLKFEQSFYKKYVKGPEDVKRIKDLVSTTSSGKMLAKIIELFPGVSKNITDQCLTDQNNKDLIIRNAITNILKPWKTDTPLNGVTPFMITVELSRYTGFSSAEIAGWIRKNQPVIQIGNKNYLMKISTPILPEEEKEKYREVRKSIDYPLITTRDVGVLNPKRIIKKSRYESRPPGGGPVQRARFQRKNVSGQITTQAKDRARIVFEELDTKEDVSETIRELQIKKTTFKRLKEVIYPPSENSNKIKTAYQQLEKLGERGKLILGGNNELLSNQINSFANGNPTDFLIWNCIGFQWTKNWQSSIPHCEVVENSDESIALYYISRLKELNKILSPLSKTIITILLPSNEVFDEGYKSLGLYTQNEQERKNILEKTKVSILNSFKNADPDFSKQIKVMMWEEYLKKAGATKSFNSYSAEGRKKLISDPNYNQIKKEMLKSATNRFSRKGIALNTKTLLAIQEFYYSMYVGEGIAINELSRNGKNMILLNFEEMRVSQLEYLGADGNITIVTPIKQNEMKDFYDWKNRQIAVRYTKTRKEN